MLRGRGGRCGWRRGLWTSVSALVLGQWDCAVVVVVWCARVWMWWCCDFILLERQRVPAARAMDGSG